MELYALLDCAAAAAFQQLLNIVSVFNAR